MSSSRIYLAAGGAVLTFFSVQSKLLNLNLFIFFLFLLYASFLFYRSAKNSNLLHVGWMAACFSAAFYVQDFGAQAFLVSVAPVTLVLEVIVKSGGSAFALVQGGSSLLLLGALALFELNARYEAAILALIAIMAKQSQFPFHLWIKKSSGRRELFPSFLFYIVCQSGLMLYSESFFRFFSVEGYQALLSALTLGTGLYLAVQALLEKDLFSRHLLIIVSQACLPMAAYHSYSRASATGGVLFSLALALGGSAFGLIGYHIYLQKGVKRLDKFFSLYRSNKFLAVFYFVSGLSLAGLPLTGGYIGEDILFHGLVKTSPVLAPLYILTTAVNAYVVFHSFNLLFFGHTQERLSEMRFTKFNKAFLAASLFLIVASGMVPGPLVNSIEKRIAGLDREAASIGGLHEH